VIARHTTRSTIVVTVSAADAVGSDTQVSGVKTIAASGG
jgi:hypothetical protein